jgi:hypothetical protein
MGTEAHNLAHIILAPRQTAEIAVDPSQILDYAISPAHRVDGFVV